MLVAKYHAFAVAFLLVFALNKRCQAVFEFDSDTTSVEVRPHITITNADLRTAILLAEDSIDKLKRLEHSISMSRVKVRNNSISYAQLLDNLPGPLVKPEAKSAQTVLRASQLLLNRHCFKFGLSDEQCADDISRIMIPSNTKLLESCNTSKTSRASNHLSAYRRLLPAVYKDGLYEIVNKPTLPSPSRISDELFVTSTPNWNADVPTSDEGELDRTRNIALVQWAQFIEHDLVGTVVQTMDNDVPLECCEENLTPLPPRFIHPACAPLRMANTRFNRGCRNYVRSALAVNTAFNFGNAEQVNQVTDALDLSQLYGSTEMITESLRNPKTGELRHSMAPEVPGLPYASPNEHLCMHNYSSAANVCYKSGDSRVNVNPYVTTLYTIFLRSHNRIVCELKQSNPTWKASRLFQKARKINTGIYQKIIYEEWARAVLGDQVMDRLMAEPLNHPSTGLVSNEFANAAIRFYYSMMPGDLELIRKVSYSGLQANVIERSDPKVEVLKVENEFYKPRNLGLNHELETIMEVILRQKAMAMDTAYVDDVTRHMYRFQYADQESVGTDVLALDIWRGRDHGLAGYAKYLEICANTNITDWADLQEFIDHKEIELLQTLYVTVDNIDLIVGGIAEKPLNGATVGPTFVCIIAEQLSKTRRNHEFYASNILTNYTGAHLILENTLLTAVPTNIFFAVSETNPPMSLSGDSN